MSDRLTAARDALKALHDFLWDEMEWFSDESAPMPRYTTMAHGQKHDDLVERFHDAYPELLAAAEAPGRVAALEAALRRIADLDPDLDAEAEAAALASAKRIASNAHPTPAPAPSEPVGRCERGVYAVHAGIPIVVTCGETHDAETHEQGAPDYDHPFTPAARG